MRVYQKLHAEMTSNRLIRVSRAAYSSAASTDLEITLFADTNNLVIMTKDSDFVDAHLLVQRPKKLLHISVGNISNQNLLKLVQHNYEAIFRALTEFDFVELSATSLIVHELPE